LQTVEHHHLDEQVGVDHTEADLLVEVGPEFDPEPQSKHHLLSQTVLVVERVCSEVGGEFGDSGVLLEVHELCKEAADAVDEGANLHGELT